MTKSTTSHWTGEQEFWKTHCTVFNQFKPLSKEKVFTFIELHLGTYGRFALNEKVISEKFCNFSFVLHRDLVTNTDDGATTRALFQVDTKRLSNKHYPKTYCEEWSTHQMSIPEHLMGWWNTVFTVTYPLIQCLCRFPHHWNTSLFAFLSPPLIIDNGQLKMHPDKAVWRDKTVTKFLFSLRQKSESQGVKQQQH